MGTSLAAEQKIDQVTPAETTSGVVRRDFSAFYTNCYPTIARALAVTLGDADLGAEATDEAMARCYSHWSQVQGYNNPEGWVYRVGFNWAISLRRRLARRIERRLDAPPEFPAIPDPAIHHALMDLDARMRGVVVCRFLLDWSVQQTADALNIRPGTVKSRTSRALEQLEARLYHFRQEG